MMRVTEIPKGLLGTTKMSPFELTYPSRSSPVPRKKPQRPRGSSMFLVTVVGGGGGGEAAAAGGRGAKAKADAASRRAWVPALEEVLEAGWRRCGVFGKVVNQGTVSVSSLFVRSPEHGR